MRLPIFRRGDFRQPPPLRNNLFYHFEHKIIDINVKNTIRDSAGRRAAIFLFSGPRFALQNRVHWFSGLAGANPSAGRAGFFLFSGPRFALQNRVHWLSGLAGANPAGGRAAIVFFSGPQFALRNRVHWLCGQAGANPAGGRAAIVFFQARGSRSKTEFIGFPDWRARTLPPAGPDSSFFQARGSRSKTEFIGFADWRARTEPAGHK